MKMCMSGDSNFFPTLHMSANDHENPVSIDVGFPCTFWRKSVNNKERLYIAYLQVAVISMCVL